MADEYGFDAIMKNMLARVPDSVDKREGSIIYDALAPTAYMISIQNYMLASLSDMLFVDTAEGEWLDRIVNDFGMEREKSSCAVRQIVCKDGKGELFDIPISSRFIINGLCFAATERLSEGNFKAICEQAGTDGNRYCGAVAPVDNISGLGVAELVAEPLIAARDVETDDELRERFYRNIRETAFGGNRADYREKAMGIEGVGACVVFAASDGMGEGNVGLMIADEQGNCASQTLIDKVKKLFGTDGDGLAPVGHNVFVKTAVELVVNADVKLTLKAGSNIELIAPYAKAAAQKYINGLTFDAPTVFYSKLAAEILNSHEAILDATLTINDGNTNIALDKSFDGYQKAVAGEIIISKAVK